MNCPNRCKRQYDHRSRDYSFFSLIHFYLFWLFRVRSMVSLIRSDIALSLRSNLNNEISVTTLLLSTSLPTTHFPTRTTDISTTMVGWPSRFWSPADVIICSCVHREKLRPLETTHSGQHRKPRARPVLQQPSYRNRIVTVCVHRGNRAI